MTKDEQNRLQKEHEAKYMKYMSDFEACGGDFSSCGGNCSSCSSKCDQEKADQKTPKKAARIVAVFSGKGGTGKSVMTCLLADGLQKMGKKVAVLDADLENPSIHYLYGKAEPCNADGQNLLPMKADSGVEFISMGNVEKDATQPLLSYGKDIAEGALYFYLNVKWSEDLDFMLIDMPSGIGDVPLQIGTIIPFDGAVCVANPSDLCDMLTTKSVNLMKLIMIPVLGVVENKTSIDLENGSILLGTEPEEHAKALKLPLLASVPLSLELSVMADFGRISDAQVPELQSVVELLLK
jgi:Mrp family chromosome partitioning ATPase